MESESIDLKPKNYKKIEENKKEEIINNSQLNTTAENLTVENSLNLVDDFPDNRKKSNFAKKKQLFIFIPIVSLKILTPVFFMLKYIIYTFPDEKDINYAKYSTIFLTLIIFYCYFLSIFTPATQTKVDKYFNNLAYNILTVRKDNPGIDLQDLNISQWFDCKFCKAKKFIRSSHCRTCNQCILYRDHHCPYIANCVGFKNIQYFVNFLFWGFYGMVYYVICLSHAYFVFKKNEQFTIPLYFKIIMIFDLGATICFILNIFGLMINILINIYNNRSQIEFRRMPLVETYCPICPSCSRKHGPNVQLVFNFYNLGFLSNLYYIIGPTPFHFIFPLPKYNNYILDENCPAFKKLKYPDRIDIIKYRAKNNLNLVEMLNSGECEPNNFIEKCHEYYDTKKIV